MPGNINVGKSLMFQEGCPQWCQKEKKRKERLNQFTHIQVGRIMFSQLLKWHESYNKCSEEHMKKLRNLMSLHVCFFWAQVICAHQTLSKRRYTWWVYLEDVHQKMNNQGYSMAHNLQKPAEARFALSWMAVQVPSCLATPSLDWWSLHWHLWVNLCSSPQLLRFYFFMVVRLLLCVNFCDAYHEGGWTWRETFRRPESSVSKQIDPQFRVRVSNVVWWNEMNEIDFEVQEAKETNNTSKGMTKRPIPFWVIHCRVWGLLWDRVYYKYDDPLGRKVWHYPQYYILKLKKETYP